MIARLSIASLLCLTSLVSAQIDSAMKVRQLTADEALEGRPVQLRATVHFIESPGTIFVQDASAGTFLRTKQPVGELRPGDVVEVEGKTFPGLFLPGIELGTVHVIGHGELPAAQVATFDDLASARFHYQRVSVEGIVRSVRVDGENRSVLRLAMGTRVLEVRVDGIAAEGETLVDAQVRITGLAAGSINDQRQLVQPYVRIAGWDSVTLMRAPPASAEVPVATTSDLLLFNPSGETGHCVRVEGVVTAVFPDGLAFIRDAGASVAVAFDAAEIVRVGERVLVQGFPVMNRFTPTLEEPRLLTSIASTPGESTEVPLALSEMLGTAREGDLVRVRGSVRTHYTNTSGQTLEIESNHKTLIAHLPAGELRPLEAGSVVELTGIARIDEMTGKGFNARPERFSLWLREAGDLRLVESPAGSTLRRLLMVFAVLAILILAALLWIMVLRRQISALRLRIRHEAALEERQRIAREFHDTLEQELAGLSLRLDAAATRPLDEKARSLLDTSRHLVSRVQIEARNLVADLRQDQDSHVELTTALQELAQRQPATAPALRVEFDHDLPPLAPHVVHHLKMIAQEAVTNTIKHARASTITLKLHAVNDAVELQIADNGQGFDVNANTQGQPGHFGCMGIRERCRKIGAEPRWISQPGAGTTLTVTVGTALGEGLRSCS